MTSQIKDIIFASVRNINQDPLSCCSRARPLEVGVVWVGSGVPCEPAGVRHGNMEVCPPVEEVLLP